MSQPKLKPCDLCHNLVALRYRVQYQKQEDWVMVCPQCWQLLSQDNPYYRYGGTWKARKK